MARLDPTGVSRILSYIKNWVTTALGGKANSSHSHSDYIPKSGGGDLGASFSRAVNDSELRIDGGTGWGEGCSIALRGKNYAYGAGVLLLHANDDSNSTEVGIFPNGAVTVTSNNGTVAKNVAMQEDVNALLNGKANSSHTHTKSEITDFPTIPSKTSQLTNDSGFITGVSWDNVSGKPSTFTPYFANGTWYAVGDDAAIGDHNVGGGLGVKALNSTTTRIDLCYRDDASNFKSITYDGTTLYMNGNCDYASGAGYANSAGYVQGNNNSANAANALLRSGSGRTDSSPEGDTWIFLDELGGSGAPWGFKHNQAANTIGFYGAGTETSSINLSNGYFSGSCNYANSSGNADTVDGSHAWQMQTLASSGVVHGSNEWLMQCQYNVDGDGYFKLYCGDKSIGTKVDRATNAGYTDWLRTSSHTDHLFHTEWDGSYFWTYVTAGDGGYRGVRVERSNSSGYADSAGNSDTLDGYHEYSFLRYRGETSASGEGTLWAQIGIKEYHSALPDGLSGRYDWGEVVSFPGTYCRFDIYCSHMSSDGNGLYYRSGWGDDKKAWRRINDEDNTYLNGYRIYVG